MTPPSGLILQDDYQNGATAWDTPNYFQVLLGKFVTLFEALKMLVQKASAPIFLWYFILCLMLFLLVCVVFLSYFLCKSKSEDCEDDSTEDHSENHNSRRNSHITNSGTVETLREIVIHPPLKLDYTRFKYCFSQTTSAKISSYLMSNAVVQVHQADEKRPKGLLSRRGIQLSKLKLPADNTTDTEESGAFPGRVIEVGTSMGRLKISSEIMGNANSTDNNPSYHEDMQGDNSRCFVVSTGQKGLVGITRPRDLPWPLYPDCEKLKIAKIGEEFSKIPLHQQLEIVPGSRLKNRYPDVLPNEKSRVFFSFLGDNYYINANYISGYENEPRAYIATQGPLSNTIEDFWHMIWYSDAHVIVMLTNFDEYGVSKCDEYFPLGDGYIGSNNTKTYGSYAVTVLSVCNAGDEGYSLRTLRLKRGMTSRKIFHFWFKGWEDHVVPTVLSPLIYFAWTVEILCHEQLREYCLVSPTFEKSSKDMQSSVLPLGRHPIVVHCSAGLGRTGCFLAICIGINEIIYKGQTDVKKILCQLREDRGRMVPSVEEYVLIHEALDEFKLLNSEGKMMIPNIPHLY